MIFRPFFGDVARHVYKLVMRKDYRKYCMLRTSLGSRERYKMCTVSVNGKKLQVPDAASFLASYRDIYVNKIYKFEHVNNTPSVLDLGANIGLSVLYFKELYPDSHVVAYEPDAEIFKSLVNNVHGNGLLDVELINKAVWTENTVLKFYAEGADAGKVVDSSDDEVTEVDAADITKILNVSDFDFLKMDIEGAENSVFLACKNYLHKFKFIFLEYHSVLGDEQMLPEILGVFKDAGFRFHIHGINQQHSPFVNKQNVCNFDNQLNIFAWKEK